MLLRHDQRKPLTALPLFLLTSITITMRVRLPHECLVAHAQYTMQIDAQYNYVQKTVSAGSFER